MMMPSLLRKIVKNKKEIKKSFFRLCIPLPPSRAFTKYPEGLGVIHRELS
jgi:hypothetical protein